MESSSVLIFCEKFSDFSLIKGKLMVYGYNSAKILHAPAINDDSSLKELKPAFILFRLYDDLKANRRAIRLIIRSYPEIPVINLTDYYTEDIAFILYKSFRTEFVNINSMTVHQLKKSILSAKRSDRQRDKLKQLKSEVNQQFKNNPQPMWLVDIATGKFLRVNKAAVKKYGYTTEEFLQLSIWDIRPREDVEKLRRALSKKRSYVHQGTWRHLTKDQKILFVEIISHKTTHKGRPVIMAMAIDVTEKHLAVIRQKEKQRYLDAIFSNALDAILIYNQEGNPIDANIAACNLLKYSKDELLSLHWRDVFNHSAAKKYSPLYASSEKSTKHSEIVELRTKDNNKVYGLYKGVQNILPGIHLAVVSDVTEEVLREQEIERIKANQAALINTTNDAVWSVDRDLKLLSYNKYFLEIIKVYTSREIREGNPIMMDEFPQELANKWTTYYRKALGGETFQIVEEITLGNGSVQAGLISISPIKNKDGAIEGVACFSKDITDIKMAKEKLALSEKRFKSLVQDGSDMIAILEKSGLCTYISPTTSKILGIEPDELIGKNAFQFIHDEDHMLVKQQLQNLETLKTVALSPFRIEVSKDSWRWIETILTDLSNDPAINGVVANSRDVTHRILGEQERDQLIEDLKKYNQELLQFSYITSHNLRAPLSNLIAISNMINPDTIQNATTAKLLSGFKTSTSQLNDTVNDLIDTLRIKEKRNVNLELLDIKVHWDLCLHIAVNKSNAEKPRIQIDFSKAPYVYFNKAYLNSLFSNLISNSLKFRFPERPLIIDVRSEIEDDQTVIIYSDNGIGIDLARYGKKVFGFHQRFHRHIEGKGFGLFLLRSQVTACGGSIDVESEPGKGIKFIVRLKNNVFYAEKNIADR